MTTEKKPAIIYAGAGERLEDDRAACAIRALAVALEIPLADARATLERFGRKRGRRTPRNVSRVAYHERGLHWRHLTRAKTLERFVREHNAGRYICRMRGHMFAIVDGIVHPCGKRPAPRARVLEYWAVR